MSASSFIPTYDLLKDSYGPLIMISEAAQICGNHVSTWYQWISDGTMPVPFIMLGKSRRIRLIDLCNFLDAQAAASAPAKPKKKRGKRQLFNLAEVHAS